MPELQRTHRFFQGTLSKPIGLRDAALRGLALVGYRCDPVTAAAANAALARLAETDPDAGLLRRIYQMHHVRPAAYWPTMSPQPQRPTLPSYMQRSAPPGPWPSATLGHRTHQRFRNNIPLFATGCKMPDEPMPETTSRITFPDPRVIFPVRAWEFPCC